MQNFPDVDAYLERAEQWPQEISALRPLLRAAGLAEEIKWGKPCYTYEGTNIVILQEFKDFLAVMFFKGVLLEDPEGVLESQGEHTRSARRIPISSPADVERLGDTISALVAEAVAVEEAGWGVPPPELVLVEELRERLASDPDLSEAFDRLTPGRQREYNLHVSGAKRAETRVSRVDRIVPRIVAGRGLRDR